MLTGEAPFAGDDTVKTCKRILDYADGTELLTYPEAVSVSLAAKALIKALLNPDLACRYPASLLLVDRDGLGAWMEPDAVGKACGVAPAPPEDEPEVVSCSPVQSSGNECDDHLEEALGPRPSACMSSADQTSPVQCSRGEERRGQHSTAGTSRFAVILILSHCTAQVSYDDFQAPEVGFALPGLWADTELLLDSHVSTLWGMGSAPVTVTVGLKPTPTGYAALSALHRPSTGDSPRKFESYWLRPQPPPTRRSVPTR